VVGGWRRLDCEEFCNMYTSQNLTGAIMSKRLRKKECVVHMKKTNLYKILVEKP
jgi:hypothetical protein